MGIVRELKRKREKKREGRREREKKEREKTLPTMERKIEGLKLLKKYC